MSWWSERTIQRAVLLSLMAHGLLLFVYRLPELGSVTHAVLKASFGQKQAENKALAERAVSPESPLRKQQIKPANSRSVVLTSSAPSADTRAAPVLEPMVAVQKPAESARAQEGGENASTIALADAVKEYRLLLARQARSLKSYPALARQRGWEGNVDVVVNHLRGGMVGIGLKRSSGFELLDSQAISMLERAVKLVELPPALAEKSFQMSLNVEYRLDEE